MIEPRFPEPFSDDAAKYSAHVEDIAYITVEDAFNAARAPYGDEGAGYDLNLMSAALIQLGWTPPRKED